MIRSTCRSDSAATARAIARYVLPVPAGPIPNMIGAVADGVDIALLRDRLRRDALAAVRPDDVLEDLANVFGLVERAEDRIDGSGADFLPSLDEVDELLDDRLRLGDLDVVAGQREPVSAQVDGTAEPLPQGVEYPVTDACELRGDVVRNVENRLHKPSVGVLMPRKDSSQKPRSWLQPESQLAFRAPGRSSHPLLMRRHGLVIVGALALAALVATSARAHSTPGIRAAQAHARRVEAEVNRIGISLEATIQSYDGAEVELRQVKASLKSNTHKLGIARTNFHAAQQRIMSELYSLYVNGKPTTLDVLAGARSLSQLINRAEAAQAMSQQDKALGTEALQFEQAVQTRQNDLTKLRAKRAHAVLSLVSQKHAIEAALAHQQSLLRSIHSSIHQLQVQEAAHEAELRREYEARLVRQQQLEQQQQEQQQQSQGTGISVPPILSNGNGHPEAAHIALQYLGVPYTWGGASPSTGFDCSGLVMYVYAQLGISLDHYTVSQWNETEPISQAQAQPGDLVFFNGLEHVGIYLGGGQMVDAPHTGAVVRVESIYGFGSIDGFRRVP